jgi:probable HAF family extracellular repeat protein
MSPPRILSLLLALAIPPISASILRAQPYLFTITDLGTLGGQESQANAVNDYGQVAGKAMTSFGVYRAFGYANGVMYDLGTLGGDYSAATGINNQGQIVGESTTSFNVTHAFSFANGAMYDLGTLGGDYSTAAAINNHGLIVGTAATSSNGNRAFAFTTDGVMHDLGTLGGASSTATAVSDNNVVVGTSAIANPPIDEGNDIGFVFSGASMQNLAALGPGPPYNLRFPHLH